MRLFRQPDTAIVESAARPARSTCSTIGELAESRVFLVVGMTVWTVCNLLPCQIDNAVSGVVSMGHKPQVRWINAGSISANVVNRCGVMLSRGSGERNVCDKELVRESVSFELTLLVHCEAFNNQAISEPVSWSDPNPASGLFVQLDHFSESVKQRSWFFPYHVGGDKKPTRLLEVKSAHDEPQPANELEIPISCFVPLQGNAIVNQNLGGVNA